MEFAYLGLSDELLGAVKDAGYKTPTPIQKQAIPAVLQGRNLLGIAPTGTGKTASFVLPMIDILASGRARARMSRTLILEPTRELAAQVDESFIKYGKNHKLTTALLIGGVSFVEQFKKLDRGVDVLIATPGRLLDHFARGKLMLTGVEIFVVDEADRMLDMGFIPDVEKIWKLMTKNPQTLFFSATMPPPVKRLTDRFLNDPKIIEVAPPATAPETVKQQLMVVAYRNKDKALKTILNSDEVKSALIFCNRKKEVKAVHSSLRKARFQAEQLHGDMAQLDRMEVLAGFKDKSFRILVASDVAARGLDIPEVSHVINYDVPEHPEDYVHRIGRTGRAGLKGCSITMATPKDGFYVAAIEKLIGQKIEKIADGDGAAKAFEPVEEKEKKGQRGRNKKRGTRQAKPSKPPSGQQNKKQSSSKGGHWKPDDNAKDQAPKPAATKDQAPKPAATKGGHWKPDDEEGTKPATKQPEQKKPQKSQTKNKPVIGMGDDMPAFMRRDKSGK